MACLVFIYRQYVEIIVTKISSFKIITPIFFTASLSCLLTITSAVQAIPADTSVKQAHIETHSVINTTQAVEDLQNTLRAIKQFSANFSQSTHDNAGNVLQSVDGFMQVAKPGKLRWKTEGVYEQLVISDGASIWIYDADLEQVSIKNMDNRLSETPALLLGGDVSAIDEDFIISKVDGAKGVLFILQPKDSSQLFDSLEVRFNTSQTPSVLTDMVIRDASGQITSIQFYNVQNNPDLKDSLFRFEPPAGVDVIDGRHGAY